MKTGRYTRREFIELSAAAAAGAAILPLAGCGERAGYEGVLDVPPGGYPYINVSGTHREIGRKIGSAMRDSILGHLRHADDYKHGVAFLEGEGRETVERMLAHAREAFPGLVEELEGMAEALEMSFMNLFAFNCRSEVSMLRDAPGCSTMAIAAAGRAILVHNEDGSDLNIGRMFVARVTPPSGVTFLAFVYPGLLPGNGPGLNDRGIVQTTNYIQPINIADGVPRYFVSRAVLEARDLDEAVAIATAGPRAFPFHHNLMSLGEARILSVETTAWPEPAHDIIEVDGFYLHTNHFLHGPMAGGDGDERPYDVPYESSTTRYRVLTEAVAESGEPDTIEEILGMLSLHEGRPYSPCRHPEGDVHGATLGTAVFQAPLRNMTLVHGNPCRKLRREHNV